MRVVKNIRHKDDRITSLYLRYFFTSITKYPICKDCNLNAAQIDLIVEGKVDKNGREDVNKKLIAMNSAPSNPSKDLIKTTPTPQDVVKTKIKCLAPECLNRNASFGALNMPR